MRAEESKEIVRRALEQLYDACPRNLKAFNTTCKVLGYHVDLIPPVAQEAGGEEDEQQVGRRIRRGSGKGKRGSAAAAALASVSETFAGPGSAKAGRSLSATQWGSRNRFSGTLTPTDENHEFMNSPITDIKIVLKGEKLPEGYQRIEQFDRGNLIADVNKGNNGKSVFICVERGGNSNPVTSIAIIREGQGEFVPPGFTLLERTVSGQVADLCNGSGSSRVFLCYCKGSGPPMVNIGFVHGPNNLPDNYVLLNRTPLGHLALLNRKHKSNCGYLCYARDLREVDALTRVASHASHGETEKKAMEEVNDRTQALEEGDNAEADDEDEVVPVEKLDGQFGTPKVERKVVLKEGEASQTTRLKKVRDQVVSDLENETETNSFKRRTMGFSPEIAAELADPEALTLVRPLLYACYSGHPSSVIIGLKCLEELIESGYIRNASVESKDAWKRIGASSGQMTLFDFVVKTASDCTELGLDVVMAPAMGVVLAAVIASPNGLHPISLHFAANATLRMHGFFQSAPPGFYDSGSVQNMTASSAAGSNPGDRMSMSSSGSSGSNLVESPTVASGVTGSFGAKGLGHSRNSFGSNVSDLDFTLSNNIDPLSSCTVTFEDLGFVKKAGTILFESMIKYCAKSHVEIENDISGEDENFAEHGDTDYECENNMDDYVRSVIIGKVLLDRVAVLRSKMEITDEAFAVLGRHTSITPEMGMDIHLACRRMFPLRIQQNVVALLIWFSKVSVLPVKPFHAHQPAFNVGMNTKKTAMSLVKEYLVAAATQGGSLASSATFGYQVRRFAFHAVLNNVQVQMLPALISTLSELWKHYRRHLKIEMAVVLENILLCVLRSKYSRHVHRKLVLDAIVCWFGMHPGDLVELFLNFQNDPPVKHWKTFENIVETMCAMGENCSRRNWVIETADDELLANDLQCRSLNALVTILRLLMDASANVHLMARDETLRLRSVEEHGEYGWESEAVAHNDSSPSPVSTAPSSMSPIGNCNASSITTPEKTQQDLTEEEKQHSPSSEASASTNGSEMKTRRSSVRVRHELQQQHKETLDQAIRLARERGVKKAVQLLVAKNYVEETPAHIAQLLHVYHKQFGERAIGEYLGEKGPNEVFKTQLRIEFTRALPFAGNNFEECLRVFLTKGGFHMPGEAQKIETMVEAFAHCYHAENPNDFENEDVVLLLAFLTVMLNTSLHNPSAKKSQKFTKESFFKQLHYIEKQEFSREFADKLYDSIQKNPIKFGNNGGASDAGGGGNEAKSDGLANSMSTSPNSMSASNSDSPVSWTRADEIFESELSEAVRCSWAIVSGCSSECRIYHSKVNAESVRVMFEVVWVHFYGIVTSILENPKSYSLEMVSLALDMLRHSISASLFLGMETERRAFATLLAKLHYMHSEQWDERGNSRNSNQTSNNDSPLGNSSKNKSKARSHQVGIVTGKHLEREWFSNVMNASCDKGDVIEVIAEIHHLTSSMKERLTQRQTFEKLVSIQKRFHGSADLTSDVSREFIREGPLLKRCRHKDRKYQFFLFSDTLIYASQKLGSNKYHTHQRLPLQTMRVFDVPDKMFSKNTAFEIRSPIKNFTVQASSRQQKVDWMRDIRMAIDTLNRKRENQRSMLPSGTTVSSDTSSNNVNNTVLDSRPRARSENESKTSAPAPTRDQLAILSETDDDDDDDDDEDDLVDELYDLHAGMSMKMSMNSSCEDDENLDRSVNSLKNTNDARKPKPISHSPPNPPLIQSNNDEHGQENENEDIASEYEQQGEDAHEMNMEDVAIDDYSASLQGNELNDLFLIALRFSKPILLSKHATYRASDPEKLTIYGYFKQATQGDCTAEMPSRDDWVAYEKWKSWKTRQGTTADEAMRKFISVLNRVAPDWHQRINVSD